MARSKWIGAPLLVLVLTTAGFSQSPPPAPAAKHGERIITLQELDLPPQKCRVVKTWQTPDGAQAYQVQSLETNETLTVVESGEVSTPETSRGPKIKAVSTRIFHWGQANRPPVGCPVAPLEAVAGGVLPAVERGPRPTAPPIRKVNDTEMTLPSPAAVAPVPQPVKLPAPEPVVTAPTTPAPSSMPQLTTKPLAQMPQAETTPFPAPQGTQKVGTSVPGSTPRPLTAPLSVFPPQKPSGVPGKMWPAAFADQPPHPSVDPVIALQNKPKEQTTPGASPGAQPISVYPPTTTGGPIKPEPKKPESVVKPEPVKPEVKKPAPAPAVPAKTEPIKTEPTKPAVVEPKKPVEAPKKPEASKVEPPQPTDYRQSWGKVESKPVEPVDKGSRPVVGKTTPGAPPMAKQSGADPLSAPDAFNKKFPGGSPTTPPAPTPVVTETKKPAPAPKPVTPAPAVQTPPPGPPGPTLTPTKAETTGKPEASRTVVPATMAPPAPPAPTPVSVSKPVTPVTTPVVTGPTVTEVPTSVPPMQQIPPGSGSVLAAGDPKYIPVPVVTVPDFQNVPRSPMGPPPQAPQPNRAMMQPGPGVSVPDQVGNAFSTPSPARPIPTDMGKTGPMGNAFVGQDTGVVMQPPMMGQGMPGGMMPRPPYAGQPQIVPGQPMLVPQPIPGMAQGPYQAPASPQMPTGYGQQPGYPVPLPQQVVPATYRPTQGVTATGGTPTTPQTIAMLTQSDYPSQREWAADQLAELNWRQNAAAVEALANTASHDPAPLVRCACLRGLAKMGAATPAVLATVEAMTNDPDPRVKEAATESLTGLQGSAHSATRPQ